MLTESASPPLSRTGSTSLPLCSQLLSPGPQPFWSEEKVAAFSLPLSLRGIALERLRLLFSSSRGGALCSLHLGDNMFAKKKSDAKKPSILIFFKVNFFFPCIQLPSFSSLQFYSCCSVFYLQLELQFCWPVLSLLFHLSYRLSYLSL